MNRQQNLNRIGLIACVFALSCMSSDVGAKEKKRVNRDAWKQHVGKTGPSGWRVQRHSAGPDDHGPDGFNPYDWDG